MGLLIGFGGILLTLARQLQSDLPLLNDRYHMCILGSAMSWALGSLVSRHLPSKLPHLTSAGFQMLFGGLSQTSLGTAVGEWQRLPDEINAQIIGTFLYVLVFGSLSGFVAFNWLLGHVPAAKVGTYAYVNPIIAVFIGWCVNETVIDLNLVAGIGVILLGVYLVRGDHRPAREIELEPD
jgi:drug/metabolite transporter (DMT)-like permease